MIERLEQANKRAYEQFADKVARVEQQLSEPVDAAPHRPSDDPHVPSSTSHPAGDGPSFGKPKRRGLFGFLLLIACIGVTALAWRLPYGDAVKQKIVGRSRQVATTLMEVLGKPEFARPTSSAALQADGANIPPSRTAPPVQILPNETTSDAIAPVPESEQLLRAMARDVGALRQELERLKADQGQIAHDNAKFADELKASKEQTARDIAEIAKQLETSREQMASVMAKVSRFNRRPGTSAPLSVR